MCIDSNTLCIYLLRTYLITLYLIAGGEDYNITSTNVTFFVGNRYQFFNIFLIDDNILEPAKQFGVVIKAIHLIGGQQPNPPVIIGSTTVANGVIIDNDGKIYLFSYNYIHTMKYNS